jgi:hypothetical protein
MRASFDGKIAPIANELRLHFAAIACRRRYPVLVRRQRGDI